MSSLQVTCIDLERTVYNKLEEYDLQRRINEIIDFKIFMIEKSSCKYKRS